jgi:hypothetical protein
MDLTGIGSVERAGPYGEVLDMRRDEIGHDQGYGKGENINWHGSSPHFHGGENLLISTRTQTSLAIVSQDEKLVKRHKGVKRLVSLVFSTTHRICTEYNNMSSPFGPSGANAPAGVSGGHQSMSAANNAFSLI